MKPSLDRTESPRPEVDESCAAGSGSNDEIPLPLSEAEVDKWFAEFHATYAAHERLTAHAYAYACDAADTSARR